MVKVIVLGLDGASPILINRWIEELPTFKTFQDKGVFGQTLPPIPPQTPVAWASFMTGKNPGGHGIFCFAQRQQGTYERHIVRPATVKSKPLWSTLSRHGRRVGVVNVPLSTYQAINGFMIPGFLDDREGIPQPFKIREKVKKELGVDKMVGDVEPRILREVKDEPERFFERVFEITERQFEISSFLLREENPDFFMSLFMGADRIQHFFWRNVDENHPNHLWNQYSERSRAYYKKMDGIIHSFIKNASEDTVTILVSDHGFCPVFKEVFLNNYLEEAGYLMSMSGKVNLEKSMAIAYGYGDIWLNVKGREPKGVISKGGEYEDTREAIINSLESIKIDGIHPIKEVKKREDVYWGPYVDKAPDLVTVFNHGWQAARKPEILDKKNINMRYVNDEPMWSGGHDGTHDPNEVPGVIGILGPDIVRDEKPLKAFLWDLSPTILKIMSVPIPEDTDGSVLPIF